MVRHGMTIGDENNPDASLSGDVVSDLKAVGLSLRKRRLACVYTSPSLCAVETSRALTHYQPVDIQLTSKLENITGPVTQASLLKLQQKVSPFLYEVCKKHNGDRICLVTHKVVLEVMMATLLSLSLSRLKELEVRHGTVSIARYDGEIELKHIDCAVNKQEEIFN